MNKLLDYLNFQSEKNNHEKVNAFNQYLTTTSFEQIKEEINSNPEEVSILNNLIATNNLDLLKLIMDYDIKHNFFIDWNIKNENDRGHNALLKSVYYDNEQALKLILEHAQNGAKIDFFIKDNRCNDNIIMMCLRTVDSMDNNNLSILKILLDYKSTHNLNFNFYEEDELKHGLMSIALIARGDIALRIKMVHLLFDYGYDINHQDSRGDSFFSSLFRLSEEIETVQLLKEQYEFFESKFIFSEKSLYKIFENTAYSYNLKLIEYVYQLEAFEKLEYIEYIQNNFFNQKSGISFSPLTIEYFNQKKIQLIEKEKTQIENNLNSINSTLTINKKSKI